MRTRMTALAVAAQTAGMIAASVLIGGCTQSSVAAPAEPQSGRYTCTIKSQRKLHCANSQQSFDINFNNTYAIPKIRRDMGGKNVGICLQTIQKKQGGGLKGDLKCKPKK